MGWMVDERITHIIVSIGFISGAKCTPSILVA